MFSHRSKESYREYFRNSTTRAQPAMNMFSSRTKESYREYFRSSATRAQPATNMFSSRSKESYREYFRSSATRAQPATNMFSNRTKESYREYFHGSATRAQPATNMFSSRSKESNREYFHDSATRAQPARGPPPSSRFITRPEMQDDFQRMFDLHAASFLPATHRASQGFSSSSLHELLPGMDGHLHVNDFHINGTSFQHFTNGGYIPCQERKEDDTEQPLSISRLQESAGSTTTTNGGYMPCQVKKEDDTEQPLSISRSQESAGSTIATNGTFEFCQVKNEDDTEQPLSISRSQESAGSTITMNDTCVFCQVKNEDDTEQPLSISRSQESAGSTITTTPRSVERARALFRRQLRIEKAKDRLGLLDDDADLPVHGPTCSADHCDARCPTFKEVLLLDKEWPNFWLELEATEPYLYFEMAYKSFIL